MIKSCLFAALTLIASTVGAIGFDDKDLDSAAFVLGYSSALISAAEVCPGKHEKFKQPAVELVAAVQPLLENLRQFYGHAAAPDFTRKALEQIGKPLARSLADYQQDDQGTLCAKAFTHMENGKLILLDPEFTTLEQSVAELVYADDYTEKVVDEMNEAFLYMNSNANNANLCFDTFKVLDKTFLTYRKQVNELNEMALRYFQNEKTPQYLFDLHLKFSGINGEKNLAASKERFEIYSSDVGVCKRTLISFVEYENFDYYKRVIERQKRDYHNSPRLEPKQ